MQRRTDSVITGLLGRSERDAEEDWEREGKEGYLYKAPAVGASGLPLNSAGSLATGCHC